MSNIDVKIMDSNKSSWPPHAHCECLINYQNARILYRSGWVSTKNRYWGLQDMIDMKDVIVTTEVAARLGRSEKQHLNGEEKSMYIYSQQQITKNPKKS